MPPFSRGGHTLLELLVVLGLIGVLAAAGGAVLRTGDSSSALRSSSQVLEASLQSARSAALARQLPTRLLVAAEADQGTRLLVVVEEPAGSARWNAMGEVARLPRGVDVRIPASAWMDFSPGGLGRGQFVHFDSRGRAPGAPLQVGVSLSNSAATRALSVRSNGSIVAGDD